MSRSVDERVVQMQFNNRQFETNARTSMSTLEKLRQSLSFKGAEKGFENISSAAKNVDVGALGNAVETVKMKFSALEVMAVTALANITNSAVNAGKNMLSALTVDPIMQGFQEYETQINSVQTILANTSSKGTTLDQVNGALDELNTYADKTIYNFTEMTRNIGTFTAAGVDLDTSVSAIKGIANLAAVSGSDSNQASSAMYQLSQALAAGTVKLQDWNSVVNAGMGGQVFQDALLETARTHGIAVDDMITKNGSFRDSLQEEWLSAEILTETLNKFTGDLTKEQLQQMGYTEQQIDEIIKMGITANDAATKVKTFTQLWDTLKEAAQSGWTQSWEYVIGDFEEAKEIWTGVSDTISGIINKSAEARNEMLKTWKDLGGRTDLIESFKNVFNGLISVVKPIKEAFRDIFPRTTGEQLAKITKNIREFTSHLKLSDSQSEKLKTTFKGLFSILDMIKKAFSTVTGVIFKGGTSAFGPLLDSVLTVTSAIGSFFIKINNLEKKFKVFETISETATNAIDKVKEAFSSLKDNFSQRTDAFEGPLNKIKETFTNVFDKIKESTSDFSIIDVLGKIVDGIVKILDKLVDSFNSVDFDGITDLFSGVGLTAIAFSVKNFIDGLTEPFEEATGMLENIKEVFGGVQDILSAYQEQLKAKVLITIATAVGILAASIVVLSSIDSGRLAAATAALGALFAELLTAMKIYTMIGNMEQSVIKASTIMTTMSISLVILSSALVKIGKLKWKQLAVGLTGLLGATTILITAMTLMSKFTGELTKGTLGLIAVAYSLDILAGTMKKIGKLSWKSIGKGLAGILGLLTTLSLFLLSSTFTDSGIGQAISLVIIAESLKKFAVVMEDIGSMKWKEINKGLAGIGGVMTMLTVFTRLTDGAEIIEVGIALLALSYGMKVLAEIIVTLGTMKYKDINKGLAALGSILVELGVACKLMPEESEMIKNAAGILAMALAIKLMSGSLETFSKMSWSGIAKSMIMLGSSMLILATGLRAMNGTLKGSAALAVATVSLSLFAATLKLISTMSWGDLIKGLISVAGGLAIMAGAAVLLAPMATSLLAVAGSIALFSLSVIGLGAAFIALGIGIKTLMSGLKYLIKSLGDILVDILKNIDELVRALGAILVGLCEVVIEAAPKLGEALCVLILEALKALVKIIPKLVESLGEILYKTIVELGKYTGKIIGALGDFFVACFDALGGVMPKVIESGSRFLKQVCVAIFDSVKDVDTSSLKDILLGIGLLTAIFAGLAAMKRIMARALISIALMDVGLLGLAGVIIILSKLELEETIGICKNLSLLLVSLAATIALLSFIPVTGAIMAVANLTVFTLGMTALLALLGGLKQIPGISWLMEEGTEFLSLLGKALGDFVGSIAAGFMEAASSGLPEVASNLSSFMTNIQGFIDGAKSIDQTTVDGVKSLVSALLVLTGQQLLDALASGITGGLDLDAFATDIVKMGEAMVKFSDTVKGKIDAQSVEAAASGAKMLAEMADAIPNSGGALASLTGDNSITMFAAEIIPLGEKLVEFSDTVKGKIDSQSVEAAASAGKMLAEMADMIPNWGGALAAVVGENDLVMFASGLVPLGEKLAGFSDAVKGKIDTAAVKAATNAGKMLTTLANNIPNEGGMVSWFTGDNDLETFGDSLEKYGESIAKFSESLGDFDATKTNDAVDATKQISSLVNTISTTDYSGLDNFLSTSENIGKSISGFCKNITGIDGEGLGEGIAKVMRLRAMMVSLANVGTEGIENFVDNMKSLGKVSSTNLANAISAGEGSVINALTTLLNNMNNTINSNRPTIMNSFKHIMISSINTINSHKSQFEKAGKNVVEGLNNGLKSNMNGAISSIKSSLGQAVLAIRSFYNSFYSAGRYVVDGFVSGISANTYKAKAEARAMAQAADTAARNALGVESPSKAFAEIGYFTVEGFVLSIAKRLNDSKKAGHNLGSSAITGIKNAVSQANAIIQEGVDDAPMIKPVVDLSDVQNGMSLLKRMSNLGNSTFNRTTAGLAGSINIVGRGKHSLEYSIEELKNTVKSYIDAKEEADNNREYVFNANTIIDGEKVAKSTAVYTQKELNRLEMIKSRKGGIR